MQKIAGIRAVHSVIKLELIRYQFANIKLLSHIQ